MIRTTSKPKYLLSSFSKNHVSSFLPFPLTWWHKRFTTCSSVRSPSLWCLKCCYVPGTSPSYEHQTSWNYMLLETLYIQTLESDLRKPLRDQEQYWLLPAFNFIIPDRSVYLLTPSLFANTMIAEAKGQLTLCLTLICYWSAPYSLNPCNWWTCNLASPSSAD